MQPFTKPSLGAVFWLVWIATIPLLGQSVPSPELDPLSPQPLELRSRRLEVMGTDLFIEVLGADPARLETALDAAITEIRRVEDQMTDWRPSPLMTLNGAAGKGPQPVDPELLRIIGQSKEIHQFTRGAFDITFAAVGRLWDFKAKPPRIPTEEEVAAALPRVDASQILIDTADSSVTLPEGMSIGLGGIAKGYGVDRAMAVLMEQGIAHAMVNAGGDLKALGKKNGALWQVAIKHPRDADRLIALIPVSNSCVVTSGDYERFFEVDGKRYHHILDPRTGFPSTGCISATVVAPEAALADALATALCVLGPEIGLPLIEKLPRVEALVVDLEGAVHTTAGLRGRVSENPPSPSTDSPPGESDRE